MTDVVLRTGSGELHVRGVVFDLDGVLVESAPCWEKAERAAVARLGGTWPKDRPNVNGETSEIQVALLAPACGLAGREEQLAREIDALAVQVFRDCVRPIADAERVLRELRALSSVAVATNSPRRIAEASIAATGFGELIDLLVTVDDVAAGKPEPDSYEEARRQLGTPAEETIAIDDSKPGLTAAQQAGLIPVAFALDAVDEPDVRLSLPSWHGTSFTDAATRAASREG